MAAIRNIFTLCLLFVTGICTAQVKVAYDNSDNTNVSSAPAGVVLHTDPRLAVLFKKHKDVQMGVIRSGRGYRVQIYNGNDRNKATSIKVDFMRRFPGVRTYLTYVSPYFRVKVGDYGSHSEAERMYQQVSGIYNPCMIVPDIVLINTLKND